MITRRWASIPAFVAVAFVLAGCTAGTHAPDSAVSSPETAHTAPAAASTYKYQYAQVPLSTQCAADMKTAGILGTQDVGQANPPEDAPLRASASDCQTVDEWVSAAVAFPDAMGDPMAETVVPFATRVAYDLAGVCGTLPTAQRNIAPLCIDARQRRLNKGLW